MHSITSQTGSSSESSSSFLDGIEYKSIATIGGRGSVFQCGSTLVNSANASQVFSDIQCGVLLVAAATKISRCILTGGGIVVRTATNSSSAQAVLVSIEDNKLYVFAAKAQTTVSRNSPVDEC